MHKPYGSCFAFLFEVLHEPYGNCHVFLFEVYIKQSQIWDTLPTSKMELFVIKRICKVISCRLVILYTQYCPMNFFVCHYRVHSVLGDFTCKNLKILLVVAITIANVVFYWTIVFDAQFLPMNFSFLVSFVAESILLQVVPPCSRWFQVVPACSRCIQLLLGSSSTFQVVPSRSSLLLVLVCMQNLEFNECWG